MIRSLTTAHRELRDLDDEALDAVAEASRLTPDLVRLHREIADEVGHRWYDLTDMLLAATTRCKGDPHAAEELGTLVLCLPQMLSRAEARFATALARHADLTVVAGLTGVERADRATLDSLALLELDPRPVDSPRPATATEVLNASDSDDEVRCVVRDVVRTLTTTPAHRVAVLYGNATPYARLLHEHLAAAGIAINGVGVRPVRERAAARFLVDLLDLVERDLPRSDLFRALGQVSARQPRHREPVPVARWDRVSRAARVVAGDDWEHRIDAYVAQERATIEREQVQDDPRQGVIERSEHNIDTALRLQEFAVNLCGRLRRGRAASSWAELSEWALGLIHDLIGSPDELTRLPVEEQYAAATVEQVLRGLDTLDEIEQDASIVGLRDVLDLDE
ncbi:MAG: hypothetical protein ACRDMV_24735 [Streptosporangiales bacterium]